MTQRNTYAFSSNFLQNAQRQFHRRAKSLSHRGDLDIWGRAGEADGELLEVVLQTVARRTMILCMRDGNRIDVFIRSSGASDRGRVLLRLEDLRVPDNAEALVAAFEATISLVKVQEQDWALIKARIRELWMNLSLRPVP